MSAQGAPRPSVTASPHGRQVGSYDGLRTQRAETSCGTKQTTPPPRNWSRTDGASGRRSFHGWTEPLWHVAPTPLRVPFCDMDRAVNPYRDCTLRNCSAFVKRLSKSIQSRPAARAARHTIASMPRAGAIASSGLDSAAGLRPARDSSPGTRSMGAAFRENSGQVRRFHPTGCAMLVARAFASAGRSHGPQQGFLYARGYPRAPSRS